MNDDWERRLKMMVNKKKWLLLALVVLAILSAGVFFATKHEAFSGKDKKNTEMLILHFNVK